MNTNEMPVVPSPEEIYAAAEAMTPEQAQQSKEHEAEEFKKIEAATTVEELKAAVLEIGDLIRHGEMMPAESIVEAIQSTADEIQRMTDAERQDNLHSPAVKICTSKITRAGGIREKFIELLKQEYPEN